jgi:chorismate mutase
MNKALDDLRKEIDAVDNELLAALAKRMNIVREIGKLKKEKNMKLLDEERWQKVVQQIVEKAKLMNIPKDHVKKIYEEIHKAALKIEEEYE